jgi:hypothetical protein
MLKNIKRVRTISKSLDQIMSLIQKTKEPIHHEPLVKSRDIIKNASLKAGCIAGGLALPMGPLGILTIIPDLVAIWKIQNNMIKDIAEVFNKQVTSTRKQMIHCLFKHTTGQGAKEAIIKIGTQMAIKKIGISTSRHIAKKTIARCIPVIGAVGVGAYAYYDTSRVGKTAIELFSSNIE